MPFFPNTLPVPFFAVLLMGCRGTGAKAPEAHRHRLDRRHPWHGKNRQRIESFIAQYGRGGPRYDSRNRPVAVFDWDNTIIKHDIGNAFFYWLLRNDRILQPPGRNWRRTSAFITDRAAAALRSACGETAPGQPLSTSTNVRCADQILKIYHDGKTVDGQAAFRGWNRRFMEPSYAWAIQLEAGYTADRIRDFARTVIAENLRAALGVTQTVGSTRGLPAFIRVYPQMRDLIRVLRAAGFEVWIVSASSQFVVETFAPMSGLSPDRVVGTRSILDTRSRITYALKGCGPFRDGRSEVMNYLEGKRCWINKAIFGDRSPAASRRNPDPRRRPVFAAGDSETDLAFLMDATGLKLVINVNQEPLMCHAYRNRSGRWLVNPMFIQPLPRRARKYPCATTACRDPEGRPCPCRDGAGRIIPDQQDLVF